MSMTQFLLFGSLLTGVTLLFCVVCLTGTFLSGILHASHTTKRRKRARTPFKESKKKIEKLEKSLNVGLETRILGSMKHLKVAVSDRVQTLQDNSRREKRKEMAEFTMNQT